jgi:cytochrome c5
MMSEMRFHRLAYAAICGALAAAFACSTGGIEHLSDLSGDVDAGDGVVLGPDNKPAPTGPAGSGLVTGLPCDVQAVIENRCISCHEGATPGAPRLLDYADFKKLSVGDPTKTLAEQSLIRMKNGQMPPAPAEPPNADEIQIFDDWVTGGTQKGGLCTDPPPDGGTDAGSVSVPEAGLDAAPSCTSGVMWTMGNTGSANMHPGEACNACHSKLKGPNLTFAGTVYRGGIHDIDDCNGSGAPPPVTVVITDKNGLTATLNVNDAGNFYLEAPKPNGGGGKGGGGGGQATGFRAPFRAKVVSGATQHAMVGSVTSGDCNSCHTSLGINGAPGRILAP